MANIVRRDPERQGLRLQQGSYGLDPFRLMREVMGFDPWRAFDAFGQGGLSTWAPEFEVKETDDAYVIRADVPGVEEDDLDISVTGNRLVISGHRDAEERDEGDNYFTYERSYGTFTRAFTLPQDVDAENVKADLKKGVLQLTVPKRAESKPRKISLKGVVDKMKDALTPGEKTEKPERGRAGAKEAARTQDENQPQKS
jgi:HSP20 family protein